MRKAWRIVGAAAIVCIVLGVIAVGVGFFAGSSPVTIQNHGSLAEYLERLRINRDILRDSLSRLF